jgi:hypothetical protein
MKKNLKKLRNIEVGSKKLMNLRHLIEKEKR